MGLLYDAVHHSMKVEGSGEISLPSLRISSLASMDGQRIAAATFGQGVYGQSASGDWEDMSSGLPEGAVTYRLQTSNGNLYAATDRGLLVWRNGSWHSTELTTPCYRVLEEGSLLAATASGLALNAGGRWDLAAFPDMAVYDVLSTPEYLFAGCAKGIAYYDVLTGHWHHFDMNAAVVSLSVYRGRLLGVTSTGELVMGNRRGGFSAIRFDDTFFYRWVRVGTHVLSCSGSGLYKLTLRQDKPVLHSIGIRCAVTDAIAVKDRMIVSTLHDGLVSLPFS